jgi:hypothetical protein
MTSRFVHAGAAAVADAESLTLASYLKRAYDGHAAAAPSGSAVKRVMFQPPEQATHRAP